MKKKEVLEIYKMMYLIRKVEEKIIELAREKKVTSLVHLSIGQEACAAGMCHVLSKSDYVWSNHRCHAHYIAKGGNVVAMFAELAGKENGCASGWGGSMHLVDPDVNMMGSTAIVGSAVPLAAGSALASKLRNDKKVSVVFLGDSVPEEGSFWETLNFSVVHKLPVIFFCENNLYATHSHILKRQPQRSIKDRVSSFGVSSFAIDGNDAMAVIRVAKRAVKIARKGNPVFIEAKTYRTKEHWGIEDDFSIGYRTKKEVDEWKRKDPLKIFKQKFLSFKGDFLKEEKKVELQIEKMWQIASNGPFSAKIDAIDKNSSRLKFSQSGQSVKKGNERSLTYKDAVAEAYFQAMKNDPRVFLMGEGVDGFTGIYETTLSAFKEFGSRRVIDTPVSEVAITGIAIGAAIAGMKPVVMHQRNDFLLLAFSQLVHSAAYWKYMTGGRLVCPVVVRAYVARKSGEAAQHTGSWQSLFGHIPGLKTVMPATPYDAKGLTLSAINEDDPVLILEHRNLNGELGFVPKCLYDVPIGKARIVREGKDITIVAVSAAIHDAVKTADMLLEKNISAEVIDLRSIRPIDKETIISSVHKTRKLVVIDTGFKTYGTGAEICAMVSESNSFNFPVTVRRVGVMEFPAPAAGSLLEEGYHPNSQRLSEVILKILE